MKLRIAISCAAVLALAACDGGRDGATGDASTARDAAAGVADGGRDAALGDGAADATPADSTSDAQGGADATADAQGGADATGGSDVQGGADATPGSDAATPADAGTPADATPASDAAPAADAQPAVDVGPSVDGGMLAAPRQIAPMSSATVTSQRPTLRWSLAAGTDGAEVLLCRDRALTMGCRTETATGDRLRPSTALARGWWFWQLRGRSGAGTGTIVSPVWQLWVGARDAAVDTSWGSIADFNGDGFADVVIGAPVAAGGDGRVYVYHGSAGGLPATPSRTLLGAGFGQLGYSVATAGDVNGDGFADLIVGASQASPGARRWAGEAHVYLGGPNGLETTPARTLEGGAQQDQFGNSVAGAGDVNGDGYADVIVGAHAASPDQRVAAGIAQIFHGGPNGTSMTPARTLAGSGINNMFGFANDQFGFSVSTAGDVNGDGYADIVVGAHSADPNGAASIFLGSASGIPAVAQRTLMGAHRQAFFGESVSCAGDVNGDGYTDIVIGAHWTEVGGVAQRGTANVFHGGPNGIGTTAALILPGAVSRDFFGNAVAGAGDVNADGYSDIIVGALNSSPGGRERAGIAVVFLGSGNGITTMGSRTYEGTNAEDELGAAVARAGDVDGDGFEDIVIGIQSASPGGRTRAGAAVVYPGGPSGPNTTPLRTYEGPAANDYFGASVAWLYRLPPKIPG